MRQLKEKEFEEQLRKQNKEYDEWENSLEGVLDDLSVWGDVVETDMEHKVLIAETLLKLPKKVRAKTLHEVVFFMMAGVDGTVFNAKFSKACKEKDVMRIGDRFSLAIEQPIIMLNFNSMKKKTKRYKMSTVAHEVAHFILGHHTPGEKSKRGEREADDLTEKWGFERAYKSKQYEIFERR